MPIVSEVDALVTVQIAPFHPSPYESTVCTARQLLVAVGAGETDGSAVGTDDVGESEADGSAVGTDDVGGGEMDGSAVGSDVGPALGAGVVGTGVGAGVVGNDVGAGVVGTEVIVGELVGATTVVMVMPSSAMSPV